MLTKADLWVYTHREAEIPDTDVPIDLMQYMGFFWEIRGFVGDPDLPMTPRHIAEWSQHSYNNMQKFEREFMFDMDRAFRHERAEVVKFHNARKQIDLSDGDLKRA